MAVYGSKYDVHLLDPHLSPIRQLLLMSNVRGTVAHLGYHATLLIAVVHWCDS